MIEISHVSKSFDGRLILDDISLVFEEGKTNLVIGGSGSGKTVLMKCLVALYQVDAGSILYDGREFTISSEEEKREIRKDFGMVFQGGALFDSQTVAENVAFPLEMFSKLSPAEIKERVDFCLNRVNLPSAHALFPSQISGGMKKRVAIARAIALNPKYLFCDEPNSGLDPKTSIVIDNLIQEITQEFNITTVINTHDMNSVLEIGQKIIYLNKGKKWWEGDKNSILETDNAEVNDFVYASELFKRIRRASQL
ncbi:MAG: ABC transporter ATP-binding protein [Bacteroidia bacterium]|jgi:phospholipid/cholesterol/gamma-HCH transport system ATP-binding protein